MDSNGNQTLYISKEETNRLVDDDEDVCNNDYQLTSQMNVFMVETYWCKIILAFVVTVFCCPILGSIAFGLAGMAEGMKYQNGVRARRLAKASIYVSVAGIVAGVIILIFLIIFYAWFLGVMRQQMQLFAENLQKEQIQETGSA